MSEDKKPENPLAFPIPAGCWPNDEATGNSAGFGMTLRDYFAGQALAGLLGNAQIAKDAVKLQIRSDANQEWHALTAYKFADAMLKARQL